VAAMGVGLGSFVDANSGSASQLGGVSYLQFIAPGLLAITAMQTAISETTYPVMAGFKWQRFYFSMAASPLEVSDIVAGQLAFVATRLALTSGVFIAVLAVFGALADSWAAPLALAAALLTGLAHAAPMTALSSRLKSESGFALVFRLAVLPMSLFSGAFFPISQLPDSVAWLAYLTPIWHGVDLTRMLTLGTVEWWPAVGHVGYLAAWLVVGWRLAVTGFAKRLAL